jgi:hypothetical protein
MIIFYQYIQSSINSSQVVLILDSLSLYLSGTPVPALLLSLNFNSYFLVFQFQRDIPIESYIIMLLIALYLGTKLIKVPFNLHDCIVEMITQIACGGEMP